MATIRSATVGPASRPVRIPDDVLLAGRSVPHGLVELPGHIWWSEPQRPFDLDNPVELRRVYELVMTEGEEDDLLHFIDGPTLLEVWPDLLLPRHVEAAWRQWFSARGIEPPCR